MSKLKTGCTTVFENRAFTIVFDNQDVAESLNQLLEKSPINIVSLQLETKNGTIFFFKSAPSNIIIQPKR